MKALLQRVRHAKVSIRGEVISQIGPGMVVLLGVAKEDSEKDADYLAEKTVNLRIFADKDGKFNLSALETKAELLVVSQFTLLGDTRKGRRPSFADAAAPAEAEKLFDYFIRRLQTTGLKVATGRFQEHMLVEIHNDGPVTLLLDSREKFPTS